MTDQQPETDNNIVINVKNVEEARRAVEHFERMRVLECGVPGELARVRLKDRTLIATHNGASVRYYLYDNADGIGTEIPMAQAHTLAAMAQAGFFK